MGQTQFTLSKTVVHPENQSYNIQRLSKFNHTTSIEVSCYSCSSARPFFGCKCLKPLWASSRRFGTDFSSQRSTRNECSRSYPYAVSEPPPLSLPPYPLKHLSRCPQHKQTRDRTTAALRLRATGVETKEGQNRVFVFSHSCLEKNRAGKDNSPLQTFQTSVYEGAGEEAGFGQDRFFSLSIFPPSGAEGSAGTVVFCKNLQFVKRETRGTEGREE